MKILENIRKFFLSTSKKLRTTEYSVEEIAKIMNSAEPIDEDKLPRKFAKTMRQITI